MTFELHWLGPPAFQTCSASSTDSVRVVLTAGKAAKLRIHQLASPCLDRLRHVEVDHSLHTLDVQAAPSHIGGHQNVVPSAGERLASCLPSMNAPATRGTCPP